MPSIRELRAICQAGKESDPRWYRIHRRLSIYVTWALLHTPATPNHATVAMMVLGAAGAVLLASGSLALNALGFALLYLAFLFDKVDGELARYHGVSSPRAVVLDRLHHLAIEPAILLAAAWREQANGGPWLVAAAFVAIVLGNIIEEQAHLPAYALFKHLRAGGRWPAAPAPHEGWQRAYRYVRPLKAFRMFIVVLPSLAVAYAVQWASGWPVVSTYLWIVPCALAAYLTFQTLYYLEFKLEDDIASYQDDLASDVGARAIRSHQKDALRTMTSRDLRDAPMARPRMVTGVEQ